MISNGYPNRYAFWRAMLPEFKRLIASGMTPREVAIDMGITRNACMGKAYREELRWATAVGPRKVYPTTQERLDALEAACLAQLAAAARKPEHSFREPPSKLRVSAGTGLRARHYDPVQELSGRW